MSPAASLLHASIDEEATFNHDTLTPAELWALGETLEILEASASSNDRSN